ncbi:YdcF family protein [Pseudoclostridium thermosuccinogenes]|uniref:YdcF family protein n=1 Tax=Clostridium thermosuccinogenes TaxID=84032 RepID=UPI002FD8E767
MQRLKRVFYIILLISGISGIFNTLVLLFYAGMNLGILLPGLAGIVFIAYACLKLSVYKDKAIIKSRIMRNLIKAGLIAFAVSFVLIEGLIIYNNRSQDDVRTDYLIILGAGLNGETVSLTLKQRLDKGIEYLNRYPDTKVIVSGGQGYGEDISEAEAMKRYLVNRGINPERVIMEDKSTSTMENFRFSKKLISDMENQDIDKIMIVTNDFHMLRSKMLARRNGFEPYGITCGTPISVRFNSYLREYFALIKSFLLDR